MPEDNPLEGRRFIGISEVEESEKMDSEFLKKFTEGEWVESRTISSKSSDWVPQGEIFIASGKPLRIHETRDEVQEIEFPEV